MENIFSSILGVICIIIGLLQTKGNISLLHSYHRKRVLEENRLPFGKMIGLGTLIIGISLILVSILYFVADGFQKNTFSIIGDAVLIIGLAVGLCINFYAMIKYNKGVF